MNRIEFMGELREALSGLPEDERANALRYYEEYFDDAENEEQAAQSLGDPRKVAEQILAEYRDLTIPPAVAAPPKPKRRKGVSPWVLAVLVLLALPLGVPLAITLFAVLGTLLLVAVLVVATAGLVAVVIPLAALIVGGALIATSFVLWSSPASALLTLGAGLVAVTASILFILLLIKLCILFVPPIIRGLVAILRWPIDRLNQRRTPKVKTSKGEDSL